MVAEKTHADLDQDGKMINPHNPDFITKVPWYLGSSGPTLKHHNIQKADHFLSITESDELIARKNELKKKSSSKGVFRKGACKNCGAMTHKEKDCVERPRSSKTAAWKSNLDIAPDEVSLNLEQYGKVNYSTKRDQWKGYNPEQYSEVLKRHSRLDEERKKSKQEKKEEKKKREDAKLQRKQEEKERRKQDAKNKASASSSKAGGDGEEAESDFSNASDASDSDSDYGSDDEDDEEDNDAKGFIEKDEAARDFQKEHAPQGGIGGNGMRVTVRNLRLREDTPKYLRNLALDSAFYDPKSRSMRLNPLPDENPEDLEFAGDNFVRHSGDALKLAQNQVLCWEMQARGESVDVISNPSQAELVQRQFVEKKKVLDNSNRKQILDKYLDGKANEQMDPRLKLGQTEAYVEYGKDGKIIKGGAATGPVVSIRTKYEEDVFTNSHTAVWGSYFNRGQSQWGYQCCHSLLRASYCTGKVGREANDAANGGNLDALQVRKMLDKKAAARTGKTEMTADASTTQVFTSRSDIFGDSSSSAIDKLDQEKLKAAYKRANSDQNNNNGEDEGADGRKRGYNSMDTSEVTLEDMEVYRMKKTKADDPMAAFMGNSEVLLDRDTSVKKLHSNY